MMTYHEATMALNVADAALAAYRLEAAASFDPADHPWPRSEAHFEHVRRALAEPEGQRLLAAVRAAEAVRAECLATEHGQHKTKGATV